MNTKKKIKTKKRGFDTVKFFRKVKTDIAKETYGVTYEQLKARYDAIPDINCKE